MVDRGAGSKAGRYQTTSSEQVLAAGRRLAWRGTRIDGGSDQGRPRYFDLGGDVESDATPPVAAGTARSSRPPSFGREGFSELLELIHLCHGSGEDGYAFIEPFDFADVLGDAPMVPEYAEKLEGGGWTIEAETLIYWLQGKLEREGVPSSREQFFKWIRGTLHDRATQKKLKEALRRQWPDIDKRIRVVSDLEDRFRDVKVGYIEVTNASPLEEMKIFFLINKGGTPLTYPEILSATSYWNAVVRRPDQAIATAKGDLYQRLEIDEPSDTCRWDVAATLALRWSPVPLFRPRVRREGSRTGLSNWALSS